MSYKYGDPVAFYIGPVIRFGVIDQITTRVGANGETTEYHVNEAEGQSTISDEDNLFCIDRAYGLDTFVEKSPGFKAAKEVAKKIYDAKNPPAPAPIPKPPRTEAEKKADEDIPF